MDLRINASVSSSEGSNPDMATIMEVDNASESSSTVSDTDNTSEGQSIVRIEDSIANDMSVVKISDNIASDPPVLPRTGRRRSIIKFESGECKSRVTFSIALYCEKGLPARFLTKLFGGVMGALCAWAVIKRAFNLKSPTESKFHFVSFLLRHVVGH